MKATHLMQRLMFLSNGAVPFHMVPTNIVPLLLSASKAVVPGLNPVFSISEDLWPVTCDGQQMTQVFNNVLINGSEAMSGDGDIFIYAENMRIDERHPIFGPSLNGRKFTRITIRDEGRGISRKHLSCIFDPYFSTKERCSQKGMGLGLTIAYAVVKRHKGHITVDSESGVGTTVSIYLPALCC